MGPTPDWPIRDLLSHRVRSTPAATGLVAADDGRSWRYDDLDRLIDAASSRFRAALDRAVAGGRADGATDARPRIVLTARTDARFAVSLFAAWRAGAAAVPIDGDLPPAVLAARLDRLAPDLVVAGDPDRDVWTDQPCPALPLADVAVAADALESPGSGGATRESERADGENSPSTRWKPDETALVVFTSGTTGDPKGVRLTHGNLVASAFGSALRLGLAPDERWLDCIPTNHVGGLAPIVRSTLYGTTAILQSGFACRGTAEALREHDATAVSLVPTQLRRLLDDGWRPADSLRFVLLGGAPASPDLIEDCEAAGVPVCPTYGTTETASQIATAGPGEAFGHPDAVGSPLVVADVTIVDRDDGDGGNDEPGPEPVDTGEIGELVVDGPIVSPGYLDDAATADAFGPFGLRTGDLASRDAAGRLRIHGRVDDAIQTGGETVHPWRVAAALTAHPRVADAAVVGVSDREWGERVGALVVPETVEHGESDGEPPGGLDGDDVRDRARRDLADYEVPRTVRVVDELPRTASGTVDRAAVRSRLAE